MASPAPSRFSFDLDLSGDQQQTRVMTETRIAELHNAARAEGYAEGLVAGEQSETSRAALALTAAGEKLARDAAAFLSTLDASDRRARSEAIGLARAIGTKLASTLLAQQPEAEIETLIKECLASLERAPHLVVRCNPELADRLKEITEAHMSAAGYSGRLIVLGDPGIAVGDGRLEWADGGLVRDMNAILSEIDKSIAAYCASSGLPEPVTAPDPQAETDHE